MCPTGHWAGGEASDCLGHKKDTHHQQLLSTEPAGSTGTSQNPKPPQDKGMLATARSGHLRPCNGTAATPPIPVTQTKSSGDIGDHTALTLGSSPALGTTAQPQQSREVRGYLGLQQGRGDQSETEQRWLEIQLGRGRVL